MKLPLLALLLTACHAHADTVIVQNVDGMAQTGQMILMISPAKVRADIGSTISTITDLATGDVTTIMPEKKSYMVISAAAAKAMTDQIKNIMQQMHGGTPAGSPPSPVRTGKTDKINGYNAAEYTFSNGNMKAAYWISSDFPNAKLVKEALAAFRKSSLVAMTSGLAPDLSTIPGVPVKSEVEINGQKITTELVSAKDQPVDPSEYQIPAGYTEVKMPNMPMQ